MITHLDETDQPCTRHGSIANDVILAYASVGSRVSGFHHDAASKLQSLMMALDELGELAQEPELKQAAETAQTALKELHQLIQLNRALTKAPQRKRTLLRELVSRSGDRFGVRLKGEVPDLAVMVASPSITHAIAMALDVAAGPVQLGRAVEVEAVTSGDHVALTFSGPADAAAKLPPNASELVAIATFLVTREEGTLRCTPNGFVIALPIASATTP